MKIESGNWTRYFASALRVLAFTLAVCATCRAWAATYVMSNADGTAHRWDGKYGQNSGDIVVNLSTPNTVHGEGNFPTSGKVALTCISISGRGQDTNSSRTSDGTDSSVWLNNLHHVELVSADGLTYVSSRVEVLDGSSDTANIFTTTLAATDSAYSNNAYSGSGTGRFTYNVYFDSVEVDVTKNLTVKTYSDATTQLKLGTAAVASTKSGTNWKAPMRIYGTSIDTATTSTPVLLVDASNNSASGTAADPATVAWLGIPSSSDGVDGGSATQGDVKLSLSRVGTGKFWNGNNDATFTQVGTFIAPSSVDISSSTFSSTVLDEVVEELGLNETQATGLNTALSKGLYNGNNVSEDETIAISGLTSGQNYTLYLAAGKADNATVLPYVKITSYARGTVPVLSYAGASATGWTQVSGLAASGTEGEATIFRIRNLYPDSDGTVVLKVTNGSHGKSGFSMLALAKTPSPANAAIGDIVKILRSVSLPTTTLLPGYSGSGVTLPSSLTVGRDAIVSKDDGVTVGNGGVQIALSSSLNNHTVIMRVSNIPSFNCFMFGWQINNTTEPYVAYLGADSEPRFEQRFLSSGSDYGSLYGKSIWLRDTSEHWVAVSYARNNNETGISQTSKGTRTYLDGVEKVGSIGLYWPSASTSKVTVGGAATATSGYSPAIGMVVKDVAVFSDALTGAQVKTVTAALNKGWTADASGTTLSGTGVQLPDGNAGTVTGTLSVATDGSWTFNGAVVSGSVTVPTGSTITAVPAGTTLRVKASQTPATLEDAIIGGSGYSLSATLTVPESVDGDLLLVDSFGNDATDASSTYSAGVRSLSGTAMSANPKYSGPLWWWDYEFNEYPNEYIQTYYTASEANAGGGDDVKLCLESRSQPYGTPADENGNRELYFQKTAWRDASFSSLTELTAVMYCQPGNYANTILVGFGSTSKEGKTSISLVTGDNPSKGEMKLVLVQGDNNSVYTKTVLANLTAVDATTKKHLYAFVMDRIEDNTKTRIRVYMDGKVKAIYKHTTTLAISDGFQIGSLHGGVQAGLQKYSSSGNSGSLDFLRVINGSLSDDAMAALANAYPYESAHGEATRDTVSTTANWVETGVWTQSVPNQDDAVQNAPNADTNVKLLVGGSSVVPVAINLDSDSNYESLTFAKGTGATGSLKLTSDNSTSGKLVSAESSILVDTVIPAGCVALGNASIADGVTLTVDPYSADNQGVRRKLETIGFGETYEDVIISMAILGQGANVTLGDQTALNALGFTATLPYNASNQSYTLRITREAASSAGNITVTADAEGNVTWVEAKGVAMPQPDSIPEGYTGTVTVDAGAYAGTITVPTMFYGGTLKVDAGSVVFTGTSTVSYDVSGTLNLTGTVKATTIQFTGSGTVNCSSANTLQGTIKGAAAITIRYPEHALPVEDAIWTAAEWRGTNVFTNCGHLNVTGQGRVPFDKYGSVNSFICAPGFRGYAAKAVENDEIPYCAATLVVDGTDVFEFNHGNEHIIGADVAAGIKFKAIVGSGKLLLDGESDIAQYIFNDVSGFTGNVEITDPNPGQVAGGKKSFIFGLPENWPVDTAFPANLVLAHGEAKVADGKEWDVPAGIVLNGNSVLNLGAGSTITVLDKRSTGTLAVPSGSATLTNVMDSVMRTKLSIGTEARLNITDTSLTTLTIPADTNVASRTYWNDGLLNLTGCTALTDLYLILGEAKTFDLSKVLLPSSCTNIYYNIGEKRNLSGYSLPTVDDGTNVCYYATETKEEYANGGFVVSNVVAGADVWLIRQNGALIHTAVSNENNIAYRYYAGGRSFAGAACWHEWDFEQGGNKVFTGKLEDTGSFSTNEPPAGVVGLLATGGDVEANYTFINVPVQGEDKCGISIATYPYPSAEISFGDTWSTAVRCTMPSEANKVAIAFGDTSVGILGLASGSEDDIVELFSWTNNVYTALAQLKVEKATTDMHIYVLAVTNDTARNYVSLYRDGEFIHKAQFALTGSIAKFKVGDVIYTDERAQTLPGVATSGFVDYVRLYDKVLPESDIQGLSSRRPFVSAINLFERTPAQLGASWSDADAWLKTEGVTAIKSNAATPDNGANVTVTVDGSPTVVMNLDSDYAYGTLIFKGTGSMGLSQRSTGKIGAGMLVVRTGVDLTVDHDAVCFTGAIVNVDPGASLKFDVSGFPFGDVKTAETNFYITGAVPARAGGDETVDTRINLTGVPAHTWSVTMAWDSTALRYKVTVAPDHNPGAEIYYKSGYITSGMTGDGGANVGTVFKNADLTEKTTLFAGDTVVISDNSLDSANNAWISDTFNGDIKVTRSVLNLRPGTGATSAILDGRTITVAAGKTLNLYKQGDKTFEFGTLTLEGDGSINIMDNASVATLTSTVNTLTIDGGKTLMVTTLALPANTPVSHGSLLLKVSGEGTVNISNVTVGGEATAPLRWARKTVGGIEGIYVIHGTIFSVY